MALFSLHDLADLSFQLCFWSWWFYCGLIFENNTLIFLASVKTVTKLGQYSSKMCLAQVFLLTISLLKTRYCLRRANGLVGLLRQSVHSSSSHGVKRTNPFILILVLKTKWNRMTHRQIGICFTVSLKLVFFFKKLIYYVKQKDIIPLLYLYTWNNT